MPRTSPRTGNLQLCAKDHYGELTTGKTFSQAAKKFEEDYEAITRGRRSPKWVQGHKDRIRLHLLPFFDKKIISESHPAWRRNTASTG